jgi:glycosyltransferase involved in cell wall biosynthesis
MSLTEKGRNWPYEKGEDLGFPYVLHRGIHPYLSNTPFHINPGILTKAVFSKKDVTIVAGGWLFPSSFLVPIFKRNGLCLFWSESNVYSQRRTGRITSSARRLILSHFDGFCIPNDRAYEWLKLYVHDIEEKQTIHLPNLVDENLFCSEVKRRRRDKDALRKRYGISEKEKVLLCPARLVDSKGVHAYLSAIRDLQASNVSILIAGEGPDRARLEELASKISGFKVRLLGFCLEDRMLDLYAVADIFLLPSFQDPNPLSVVEACHAGLPLLVSQRLGNFLEAYREGENGWAFEPSDPFSCNAAMEKAIGTLPEKLKKMGSVSSKIAAKRFSTRKVVQTLFESLQVAVVQHRSGGAG